MFPPLRLLIGLDPKEPTPARTPWPLLVLRIAIGALVILAMAGPIWNSLAALSGSGPLLVLLDDGWPAAPAWDKRIAFARERLDAAARAGRSSRSRPVAGRAGHRAARRAGVEGRLRALAPVPYAPDRAAALPAIQRFLAANPNAESSGSPTASSSAGRAPFRPSSRPSLARSRS